MKFKKPKWLKPELDEPKYWLHLIILVAIALYILQHFKGGDLLTLHNILWGVPILAVADTVAHTILRLD